ncbi:MAG: hypothetical protein JRI70_01860 [Deltaproteobacteria bacterium]|nr:hypothetical protein [Deltaproteobacteria bacterium]
MAKTPESKTSVKKMLTRRRIPIKPSRKGRRTNMSTIEINRKRNLPI